MIYNLNQVKIYLKPGATDMRKAINGLFIVIKKEIKQDPLTGSLFLFSNSRRDRLKIMYWDRNGFCLWLKRLEKDKFPWPQTEDEVVEIDFQRLQWLLSGIDFFHAHKELNFSSSV